MKKILLTALVAMAVASCGNNKKQEAQNAENQPAVQEEKLEVTEPADSNVIKVELTGTDQMTFDKNEIRVPQGKKVHLVLHHSGKMSKDVMGHNFVLLKQGTDIAKFGQEASQAKDNKYIPKMTKDVIANTDVIGGGETTEITFDVPQAGTYDYICSFPGHYALMKGKFIVE